jgi:integrase/recombinase XerD
MGSIFKQQYHAVVGGKRVRRESSKWYIAYKDGSGKWVREPAYVDKQASMHLLTRREKEVAHEAEGIVDDYTRSAGKPIGEHLEEYLVAVKNRGNTDGHIKRERFNVGFVLEHGKIARISELTRARVDAAFNALLTTTAEFKARSMATRDQYLTSIKSFAKWLVDENRTKENAIAGMRKKSTEDDRVYVRRPLTPKQLDRLLTVTAKQPELLGLTGADRVALYALASRTGYRRRELSSITPSSFIFGKSPSISVVKGYSKRRRLDTIPLKPDIAKFFKSYCAGWPADEPLWKIDRGYTAQLIQADLEAAGIQFRFGVEVVDFHALRGTFTTDLARAGVAPKTAQQLARHSDISLTMNTYTRMEGAEERAAVEKLPSPRALTKGLTKGRARHCNNQQSNPKAKVKTRLRQSRPTGAPKSQPKRRKPRD